MDSRDVVSEHRAAGRRFEAAGISSFVREAGPGAEPVVCLHGVPASCFLHRKVLRELEARRLRGTAFDLPGLGLADCPRHLRPHLDRARPVLRRRRGRPRTRPVPPGRPRHRRAGRLRALCRADQPHRPPSDRAHRTGNLRPLTAANDSPA